MRLPNFFLIGAGYCGTTSLYHLLGQHPQVFMCPIKEPAYFIFDPDDSDAPVLKTRVRGADRFVKSFEEYAALFDGVRDEIAIGEASPQYLARPVSAKCIQRFAPEARIIATLRHPAERVYSHLTHSSMLNQEPVESIDSAIADLPSRARVCTPYFQMLRPFLDAFPRDRIQVMLLEDWKRNTAAAMRELYRFLGVDPSFEPDVARRNDQSRILPSRTLRTYLATPGTAADRLRSLLPMGVRRKLREGVLQLMEAEPPELPAAMRRELARLYRDDTLALQEFLGRDLSHWLE